MAFLNIPKVEVVGISACVPKQKDKIKDIYKWDGVDNFIEATGIQERRRTPDSVTSADLCFHAAQSLISDLKWNPQEIEVLVTVTQTPDYILPATSCILQDRLGLPKSCMALDISLGCSGWVYGMSVISALLQCGTIKKGLLLVGDTPLKLTSAEDRSCYPLFGEAGTATALEFNEDSKGLRFSLNSDGSGFETIIVREGAFRNPTTTSNINNHVYPDGVIRKAGQQELDGMNVFSFGISKAPKSVKQLAEEFDISLEDIDIFTFHQANMMMNEMIRKKLKIAPEKVPYSICEFGNTSCASIPLTLVTQERDRLQNELINHVAVGFGVGLSWGSVWFETNKIKVPQLIEI